MPGKMDLQSVEGLRGPLEGSERGNKWKSEGISVLSGQECAACLITI